ncbi:MAG: hypothetical protein NUW01_14300 [Gemmatimonadaceae bacterium]|nr:hypothetical protein [Gemmatimonadaceae bacterium]
MNETKQTITRIRTEVVSAHLFSDASGYDVEASGERYAQLLRAELQQAYPGAEIEINLLHGVEGHIERTIVDRGDDQVRSDEGFDDNDLLRIAELGSSLYDEADFYVAS